MSPILSPVDNNRLFFIWGNFNASERVIKRCDLTTNEVVTIYPANGMQDRYLGISNDASFLVWNEDNNIMKMNVDGLNVEQLVPVGTDIYNTWPRFSPDDRLVIFSRQEAGSSDLFVVDADGGEITRLTNTSWNEGYPQWGMIQR